MLFTDYSFSGTGWLITLYTDYTDEAITAFSDLVDETWLEGTTNLESIAMKRIAFK